MRLLGSRPFRASDGDLVIGNILFDRSYMLIDHWSSWVALLLSLLHGDLVGVFVDDGGSVGWWVPCRRVTTACLVNILILFRFLGFTSFISLINSGLLVNGTREA